MLSNQAGLDFIGLYVLYWLFPEYIYIQMHELFILEEKRGGSTETTIRYIPMDLLVYLQGEE